MRAFTTSPPPSAPGRIKNGGVAATGGEGPPPLAAPPSAELLDAGATSGGPAAPNTPLEGARGTPSRGLSPRKATPAGTLRVGPTRSPTTGATPIAEITRSHPYSRPSASRTVKG